MFRQDRCTLCGDCLVQCQWMEVGTDDAVKWMTDMIEGLDAPPVGRCITCYACNETCPEGANPFDLIAGLQEKYGKFVSQEQLSAMEDKYTFSGALSGYPKSVDRIMSTCVFGKSDAHLIQGELYDLPQVGGKPYFCWVLFSHAGGESIQKKHAAEFIDRLALTGAKEIVCFHDDCYAMLTKLAPEYGLNVPFRPLHLSEYLVEYLTANRNRIRRLNLKVAYQRPCASRFTPEKEPHIDTLFDLIGVERVSRQYDREKAMCCAGVKFMLGLGDPLPDQRKNIQDAVDHGAEAMICLCPMCMHSLRQTAADMNMPLVFLGDAARMALGELEPPRATGTQAGDAG
jgi:Fe-S oxidoreductase